MEKKILIVIVLAVVLCAPAAFAENQDRPLEKLIYGDQSSPFYAKADAGLTLGGSLLPAGVFAAEGAEEEIQDETGTDPRDFSSKFMPYYLYVELENNIKVNQFNLFGMHSFTPNFAMTYDWPVFKDLDYGSVFPSVPGGIGGGNPGSGPGAGFTPPFDDISSSGSTTGYGDLGLRFFYKRREWGGNIGNQGDTWSLMGGFETTLPTASDDVLGGDTTIVSPMVVFVADIPGDPPLGLGFFAMMNFYDFDVDKGDSGSNVERYRGRWFWMQPLAKPGPELFDGIYVLTELQPVYDFRTDDFDLWIGPEFGKIIKEGQIVYIKPGVGFDRDATDRKFTLEIGYRYFF
jgi:hypothetical protein